MAAQGGAAPQWPVEMAKAVGMAAAVGIHGAGRSTTEFNGTD